MRAAQRAAESGSVRDLLEFTAEHVPVGDYAWQAGVLWISRGWLHAIPLAQLLLHGAALLALFHLVRLWTRSGRVAAFAVVLYACLPIDFMLPHFVASEAFFNPLLVIATLFLARFDRRTRSTRSTRDLAMAGLLYSLAAMTRPELMAWIPLMLLIVVLRLVRSSQSGAWRRLVVFVLCCLSLQIAWVGARAAAGRSVGFGAGELTLSWHLEDRSRVVENQVHAGAPATAVCDTSGGPLTRFARTAANHPGAFARQWILHVIKFVALPDNLDAARYLGLYEFTGRRAERVHTHGLVGAARALFVEMPLLMSWLVASAALFGLFWLLVVGGLAAARRARLHGWFALVLLSLPGVFVVLRLVTQGESRKRSPVDFVLVTFAALGLEAVLRWRSRRQKPALQAQEGAET